MDAIEQARRLGWHAVSIGEGVAIPGRGLHRLSFDLATGSAGLLLVLSDTIQGGGSSLPFLGGDRDRNSGDDPISLMNGQPANK
jgi:hypothetical protein